MPHMGRVGHRPRLGDRGATGPVLQGVRGNACPGQHILMTNDAADCDVPQARLNLVTALRRRLPQPCRLTHTDM